MEGKDLCFSEMLAMQRALWEKHKDEWEPLEPKYARDSILWMVDELGEVIAIIKKMQEERIQNDPAIRAHFVEELADVLMYFTDAMMRYGITAEEIGQAYRGKFQRNMQRDWESELKRLEDSYRQQT